MSKKEYELDFYQALKEMLENDKWIKGEQFIDGLFMKATANGNIVMVDAGRLYIEEPYSIHKSMVNQKYRVITVATMRELME